MIWFAIHSFEIGTKKTWLMKNVSIKQWNLNLIWDKTKRNNKNQFVHFRHTQENRLQNLHNTLKQQRKNLEQKMLKNLWNYHEEMRNNKMNNNHTIHTQRNWIIEKKIFLEKRMWEREKKVIKEDRERINLKIWTNRNWKKWNIFKPKMLNQIEW